jgi:hypothetical protein
MVQVFPLLILGALALVESLEVDRFQRLESRASDGDLCFLWGHRGGFQWLWFRIFGSEF